MHQNAPVAAAVVLIVLVVAGDARENSAISLVRAARTAIGEDAEVVIHEVGTMLSDDEARELGDVLGGDGVAEVMTDSDRSVHLRVFSAARRTWEDSTVAFAPQEPATERGRTLGYALAAMLPESDRGEHEPPAPIVVPIPAPLNRDVVPTTLTTPKRWHGAFEAAASTTAGVAGAGGGIGAALAGEWFLSRVTGVRLEGALRFGEITSAAATSMVGHAGAGFALHTPYDGTARLGFGVQLDAQLAYLQLSHLDSDDPAPDRRTRWLPGADAIAHVSWRFSPSASFVVGSGAEATLGVTDITVHRAYVERVAPVKIVVNAGVSALF